MDRAVMMLYYSPHTMLRRVATNLVICSVAASLWGCGGNFAADDAATGDANSDHVADAALIYDAGDDASIGDPQCAGRDDFTACVVVTEPDRSYDICVGGMCVSPGCETTSCNAPGPHFRLADTNLRVCSNEMVDIACPSVGEAFFGQDAHYGWDLSHDAPERFAVDTSDGNEPLVSDQVTGLGWQGCQLGASGASCAIEQDDMTYTWNEALAECDSLAWAGHDDWRLPDEHELDSIIDSGSYKPAITATVFPHTAPEAFWSSSTAAPNEWNAWTISFNGGYMNYDNKDTRQYVRCVRGAPGPRPVRLVRDLTTAGFPTVADSVTALQWQGCVQGLQGDMCELGTVGSVTWGEALAYCEGLDWAGRSDWRLPNTKELRSLSDKRVQDPALDSTAFPATPLGFSWSATSNDLNSAYAWGIAFDRGYRPNDRKNTAHHVRCVRSVD